MKKVLVIADDQAFSAQLAFWLGERGWSMVNAQDGPSGIGQAEAHAPEIVVCDLASLHCNGFQLFSNLRHRKNSSFRPLIIAAGSPRPIDRINAFEAGADEYVVKPFPLHTLDKYLDRFAAPLQGGDVHPLQNGAGQADGGVRLKFWGVRGSIPSPGPETVFYGGNTSCIEVRVNGDIIILDAGSGLRRLGLALVEEFKDKPMHLNLLITHTHWDHIQGFPFFLPAYDPKNKVAIYGYEGASQGLKSTLSSQMESPYFPISMQQMPGHITINELRDMAFTVNGVPVRAQFLNHPGVCTGYRLETPAGSIAYLPDIELYQRLRKRWTADTEHIVRGERQTPPPEDKNLIDFMRGADVLILDSQYDAVEYEKHIGWGHSCLEDSVAFALQAGVKRLFLFHHDPDHTDDQVSRMVARARQLAKDRHSDLIVEAAREGYELVLKPTAAKVA